MTLTVPKPDLFDDLSRQLDRSGSTHLYKQVKHLLRKSITSGQLRPRDPIPPQRYLSSICNVSEVTIRRAMQELAEEGFIESRAGSGTFVLSANPRSPRSPRSPRKLQAHQRQTTAGPTDRPLQIGIGFASLTDGYPFFRPMMLGMEAATPRPMAFSIFELPLPGQEHASAAAISSGDLDGMVLLSPINLQFVAHAHRVNLPCVLLYNDIADGQSRCIVVDYTPGVLQAVAHLVERSLKRIALVTACDNRFSTGQFTDAYRTALQMHELEVLPQWIIHAGYEEQHGYDATRQLLNAKLRPQAILFASDYQARGGMVAAAQAGLNVPGELAIVGTGNMLRPKESPVPLTTIDLHCDKMGRMAVELLLRLIDNEQDVPYRQAIGSELIIGATT